MKIRFSIIVIIFSLWACSPNGKPSFNDSHQITWLSLSQAKKEALASNKPMLVDFFTSKDCHRCQSLVLNIYSNPIIVDRIKSDFVPVRVNLDSELSQEEKKLAQRLESGEECVLAFLSPNGSVITDPDGKRICSMDLLTQESFIEYIDNALKNLNK